MVKVIIKTRAGTQIIVEGDMKEVEEIIFDIQRKDHFLYMKYEDLMLRRNEMAHGTRDLRPKTATDQIIKLKQNNFFRDKRNLKEISDALAKEGFHYPLTTLSAVVLRLVRRGELGRLPEKGKWFYVQR